MTPKKSELVNVVQLVQWSLCSNLSTDERAALHEMDRDLLDFLDQKKKRLPLGALPLKLYPCMLQQYALDWRLEHSPKIQ